jgi:hypothetical protein
LQTLKEIQIETTAFFASTRFITLLLDSTIGFDKAFELDESFTDLISQAKNLLFESHVGTQLLNTFICPQAYGLK